MSPYFECSTHNIRSDKFETTDPVQLEKALVQMTSHTCLRGLMIGVEIAINGRGTTKNCKINIKPDVLTPNEK